MILWTGGILVGSRAAADETASTIPKIQSSVNESDDAAKELTISSSANPLAGTSWRLVEFQSMDDATEDCTPGQPFALHHASEP
jgi:predicted secreted protein